MHWIRLAPMTAESIIICMVVFTSCSLQSTLNRERFSESQRDWGAIQNRESFEAIDGVSRVNELELYGPFDIWNGQWWRIPITVLHHHHLLHLLLNMGAAWYLGRRLERHWGSFAMGLFLIPASCVPVMAELFWGQAMIGYSGVVCAMLGTLVVLRHFDDDMAVEFSLEAAEIGIVLMVLCWLASLSDFFSFPNVGHLTGFVYGGFIATVAFFWRHQSRRVVLLKIAMIFVHIGIVPGIFVACHPVWLARYHWYRAIVSGTPTQSERCLRRAILRDPSLAGVWLRWSQLAESSGDLSEAWDRLISGLSRNRSNSPLMEGTQRLWRHLDSQQRHAAELVMSRVFGKAASLWLEQIRAGASVPEYIYNEEVRKIEEKVDPSQFALDQKVELQLIEGFQAQQKIHAPTIPADENDAMEGKSL